MTSIQVQHARIEHLRRVHNFKALCAALRKNDPTITSIESLRFPIGYGHGLGGALRANRYVTSCEFNLSSIISGDEIGIELDPLIHYLRTSKILRYAYLYAGHKRSDADQSFTQIFASILGALSANRRLEELRLDPVIRIHSDTFQAIATTCESLKKLNVSIASFTHFSPDQIAQFFGALGSLEHLALQNGTCQVDSNDITVCVLQCVSSLPKLTNTAFEFGNLTTKDVYSALNLFVNDSPTLAHVELWNERLTRDFAICFASPSRTLSALRSLKLDQCMFDSRAAQELSASVTSGFLKRLDTLHFTAAHTRDEKCMFAKHIGTCISRSCVTNLRLDNLREEDAIGFFDSLLRHTTEQKLARLSINWYGHRNAAWHALALCIPFLVHLKELQTGIVFSCAGVLLDALRQNGSLHIMYSWENSSAFNSFDLIRLCAYGRRNESLPNLLGPSLGDKGLFLFPSLCSATRHLSRMGANFALMGLLHCNHSIGRVATTGMAVKSEPVNPDAMQSNNTGRRLSKAHRKRVRKQKVLTVKYKQVKP
jgi:hypothetical protein